MLGVRATRPSQKKINWVGETLVTRKSTLAFLVAAALAPPASASAQVQDYPNRPIRAITTTSAGGLSDLFMRALGEKFP